MAPGGGTFTWRSQNIGTERWLARWVRPQNLGDISQHPQNIFQTGFIPCVDLATVIDDPTNPALDLRTFVEQNISSIFVSTTMYVRNDGRIWTPRNRNNAFRFDIYAPGGIDVNPTIGPHEFSNQNEIAFVGGIAAEHIFGALELDET